MKINFIGGITLFESHKFTKGAVRFVGGVLPTLRAQKVCVGVITYED